MTSSPTEIGEFSQCMEKIRSRHKTHNDLIKKKRARADMVDPILFVGRPLVPTRLPDGSSYFSYGDGEGPEGFGGEHLLRSNDDPTLFRVWGLCLESQSVASLLTLTTNDCEGFNYLSFEWDLTHSTERSFTEMGLRWSSGGEKTGDIEDVLDYFDLKKYRNRKRSSHSLNDPAYKSGLDVLENMPNTVEFLVEFIARFDRLPGVKPHAEDWKIVTVGEHGPAYSQWRPALNQVTNDWNSSIFAYRDASFDPYRRPTVWLDEPELRFPVLQKARDSGTAEKNLVIQVDVVHTPEGSFLEFTSQFGVKRIQEYANLAGLSVEFWDGPLASRWNTETAPN